MLIKLFEIYNEINHSAKSNQGIKKFSIREIAINTDFVVCMKEDTTLDFFLKKNLLPEGLNGDEKFTNVSIMRGQMGLDVTVVGSLETILKIVNNNKQDKNILKG